MMKLVPHLQQSQQSQPQQSQPQQSHYNLSIGSHSDHNDNLLYNMPLILCSGSQAGISGQELVALLNKSLDISKDLSTVKKMQAELTMRQASFDNHFILFGAFGTITTTIVMLNYLQDLIISCAGNVVALVGTSANYGIGGIELAARNAVPFIWNNVISFTNYVGILSTDATDIYIFDYAKESITAAPILAAANEITQNASLAALVVNIFLFLLLVPLFTILVILMLKLIQTKRLILSFFFWKMETETRS